MDSQSILNSTKKVLGFPEDDDSFDVDILMHINTVFSVLYQIGAAPAEGFAIDDASATWEDYIDSKPQIVMVKSYMALKVRSFVDPPSTSFGLAALDAQIKEFETRLSYTEILFTPGVYDFAKDTEPKTSLV